MTFGLIFGRVGFGLEAGRTTRVRLGCVEAFWCAGSIWARIARLHCSLADAATALRRRA